MEKTIYNVFVKMESQEQCDRLKALCVEYGLPIDYGFTIKNEYEFFEYCYLFDEFNVWTTADHKHTQVTEQDFIELLKNTKK